MSALAPGARRALLRWGETATYGLATAAGVWLILSALSLAPAWRWGLAAFAAAAGLLLVRSAALSALGRTEAQAPGIVTVAERRVEYFGPHQGGVVSLDEICAIEIWSADPAHFRWEGEWVLRWSPVEPALIVPVSAEGAAGLIDTFAALPGFSPERALAALRAPEGATITIWRRPEVTSRPALARRPGAD